MESYLAHITEDGRKQTVLQHLESTAWRCSTSARAFCAADQGELAGLSHDLGKYSNEFQNRLLQHGPRVDHATAGAFECFRLGQPYAAFAVAGHHSGLPDGGSQTDAPDSSSFFGRMNRALQGRLPEYTVWQSELTLPAPPLPNTLEPQLEGMFFTRMLFSCLVDADYPHLRRSYDHLRESGPELRSGAWSGTAGICPQRGAHRSSGSHHYACGHHN